jgi:hypothetical protein
VLGVRGYLFGFSIGAESTRILLIIKQLCVGNVNGGDLDLVSIFIFLLVFLQLELLLVEIK